MRGVLGRKVQSVLYAREFREVAGLAGRVVEVNCMHVGDGHRKNWKNGTIGGHIVLLSSQTKSYGGVGYNGTSRRAEVFVV